MTYADRDFINIFNEYYPFDRYIVKNPKKINYLFDDALLTEIFIPKVEIKPIKNDRITRWTKVDNKEIYVKIKGKAGEMRFAYFDFNDSIRETIRGIIIEDFGCWQSLYVEEDNDTELNKVLQEQKFLIRKNIIDWISVEDYLPEYYKEVLVAYSDTDGENSGICMASRLPDKWFPEMVSLRGENFDEEYSRVTHWFDYQEHLNYPNE